MDRRTFLEVTAGSLAFACLPQATQIAPNGKPVVDPERELLPAPDWMTCVTPIDLADGDTSVVTIKADGKEHVREIAGLYANRIMEFDCGPYHIRTTLLEEPANSPESVHFTIYI